MSSRFQNKKKVSFREVGQNNPANINRSNIKKPSILKISKAKKNEELKNDKIIEPIKEEKTEDIEKDEPIIQKNDSKKRKSNNSINDLPTEEYFKATVQRALEQGLLNLAMMHPKDPFKFLGNYLIEYSKKNSTQ